MNCQSGGGGGKAATLYFRLGQALVIVGQMFNISEYEEAYDQATFSIELRPEWMKPYQRRCVGRATVKDFVLDCERKYA